MVFFRCVSSLSRVPLNLTIAHFDHQKRPEQGTRKGGHLLKPTTLACEPNKLSTQTVDNQRLPAIGGIPLEKSWFWARRSCCLGLLSNSLSILRGGGRMLDYLQSHPTAANPQQRELADPQIFRRNQNLSNRSRWLDMKCEERLSYLRMGQISIGHSASALFP